MNSRDRLNKTLNHVNPGEILFDLGGTVVSGINADTLTKLRSELGLPYRPVKLYDPLQSLGLVEEDIRQCIGVDIVGVNSLYTSFGYKNENWKTWHLQNGTEVLVGGGFNIKQDQNGNYFMFPKGDISVHPCAKMPKGGYYFDPIPRQSVIVEKLLNGKLDFKDDFTIFSEEELNYFESTSKYLYENTQYGIIGHMELFPAGDIGRIFGLDIENPKGIRNMEDWLISHYTRSNYIKEIMEYGSLIAINNLKLYKHAVGDRIQVIPISGVDFGTQNGLMFPPSIYREIYKPYHKKVIDWVHKNTKWKVFFHSCGSIVELFDDLIEAGVDIINPVQTSARGMDPKSLKEKFGRKIVFWGGGVDPSILQFGSPEEVKNQVIERIKIFSSSGGYVFASVHNIQPNVPIENLFAMINAVKEFKSNKT
ncbi:MAG: uroporphyrinogen decarboxylase family protein [Candidatus Humimicrobiaceae bacterium]